MASTLLSPAKLLVRNTKWGSDLNTVVDSAIADTEYLAERIEYNKMLLMVIADKVGMSPDECDKIVKDLLKQKEVAERLKED